MGAYTKRTIDQKTNGLNRGHVGVKQLSASKEKTGK